MPRIIVKRPQENYYYLWDTVTKGYVTNIEARWDTQAKKYRYLKVFSTDNFVYAKHYRSQMNVENFVRRLIKADPSFYGRFNFVRVEVSAQVRENIPFEATLTKRKKANTLSQIDPRDLVQLRQQGKI